MRRFDETRSRSPGGDALGPVGVKRGREEQAALDESWDPTDDASPADRSPSGEWDWHNRSSWGRRAVAAFPGAALVVAAALFVAGTAAASGAPAPASVPGTGGARLVARPGAPVPTDPDAPGGEARYGVVRFTTPSGPSHPLEDSTSLALPPYIGWEANGSAGPSNGYAVAAGGLLHVGVRTATPEFRGWFLTTSGSVPDSCAFQFDAASPPVVRPSVAGGSRGHTTDSAIGELVMAVQTVTTATTGDIDYVVVAEVVHADGRRVLEAGYSVGHVRNAVEHVLKRVPWPEGPLQVSVITNGQDQLEVWVDGHAFLDASGLDMGITPPFQPYLEVQAKGTPYEVAFSRYASVCGDDVRVDGLPDETLARLGGQLVSARGGQAVFTLARSSDPLEGPMLLALPASVPGGQVRVVQFAASTYWPGQRFGYEPGP